MPFDGGKQTVNAWRFLEALQTCVLTLSTHWHTCRQIEILIVWERPTKYQRAVKAGASAWPWIPPCSGFYSKLQPLEFICSYCVKHRHIWLLSQYHTPTALNEWKLSHRSKSWAALNLGLIWQSVSNFRKLRSLMPQRKISLRLLI